MPSIAESVDAHSLLRVTPLTQSVLIDYTGGTNPIYVGYAEPGTLTSDAFWRIYRVTWDGNSNPTAVEWAAKSPSLKGDNLYRHVWDDRASLTYST